MISKKIVAGALGCLGVLMLQPASARQSGVMCNTNSADSQFIQYGQYGVDNTDSVNYHKVYCSDGSPPSSGSAGIAVGLYDRNRGPGDFCCTGLLLDTSGNAISSNHYCTGTALDGSNAFGPSIMTGTIPISNVGGFINLVCNIPPTQSYSVVNGAPVTTNFSHVALYHTFPQE